MVTPPTPIPILPYAGHSDKRRGWRLLLATQAAAWFTAVALLILILISVIIELLDWRDFRWTALIFLTLMYLFPAMITFVLAMFSCWIRLAASSEPLSARRMIWLFAIVHVVAAALIGFLGNEVDREGLYTAYAVGIWLLAVPILSCFFLLKRTQITT
jgi:hypothetical protein